MAKRPVIINGIRFESMKQAAKAYSVHENSIQRLVARHGLCFDWHFPRGNRLPITLDGVRYPTLTAASRATGISLSKLSREYGKRRV